MHRFLPSGMDSEFASDSNEGDRIFDSSSLYYLGLVLVARFLTQQPVKDFSPKLAGIFAGRAGNGSHRRGGVPVHLKLAQALEELLEEFLNYSERSVDDGRKIFCQHSSAEDMQGAFEEWVGDFIHSFADEQEWDEHFQEALDEQAEEDAK
jgi:hypothetical protein